MDFKGFIKIAREPHRWNFNAWIKHPGFVGIYLRYGKRRVGNEILHPVLDIANLEARKTGQGTFKRFVEFLREEYPELHIYVENAHTRFGEGLLRMGFTLVEEGAMPAVQAIAASYFMSARSDGVLTGRTQISLDA